MPGGAPAGRRKVPLCASPASFTDRDHVKAKPYKFARDGLNPPLESEYVSSDDISLIHSTTSDENHII